MPAMPSVSDQLKRHAVALVSIAIAISSFAYNSWRNEQSEDNRNIRTAGIELLIKLGELDRIVLHAQYGGQSSLGDTEDTAMFVRSGWAYALTVRDLGSLTKEPAKSSSGKLFEVWSQNYDKLGKSSGDASAAISAGIDETRQDVLLVMSELD